MATDSGRALREPALVCDQAATRLDPSGFDPAREEFEDAARILGAFPEVHPDLFVKKRRAIGIWRRAACWTGGIVLGTVADYLLTGTILPMPNLSFFWLGMLVVAAFIYFDPPRIRNIYTLRLAPDRDDDGGGGSRG